MESESGLTVRETTGFIQSMKAMEEHNLVLYPGILVSFRVPQQCEAVTLDEVIARIRSDIEQSIERHLPADWAAEVDKIA